MKIRFLLFVFLVLLGGRLMSQNSDVEIRQTLLNATYKFLNEGNCDKAEEKYNIYQKFGGEKQTDIDAEIRRCRESKTTTSPTTNQSGKTNSSGQSGAKQTTTDKGVASPITGTLNNHKYVDLGLPSGTKWATCNVGANLPEENGVCFAWGETSTKDFFSEGNYTYMPVDLDSEGFRADIQNSNIPERDIILRVVNMNADPDKRDEAIRNILSVFIEELEESIYKILPAKNDAATINWGTGWRTPSIEQWMELINKCKLSWEEWSEQNKHEGFRLTGPNGNSIFLPTTSFGTAYYWSCSPSINYPYYIWRFEFHTGLATQWSFYTGVRFDGLSIRPVCQINEEHENIEQDVDISTALKSEPKRIMLNNQTYEVLSVDLDGVYRAVGEYACSHLKIFGKNDWYLPDKEELNAMYKNKDDIGWFVDELYWSSSNGGGGRVWMQDFSEGSQVLHFAAYSLCRVRCIRKY